MAIEIGAIAPWLDNWPIYRQLWDGQPGPGNELDLVPTGRNLSVQLRDPDGEVAIASSEVQHDAIISVANQQRGLIKIVIRGDRWNALRNDLTYTVEILAYGFLYDSFSLSTALPEPGKQLLNGVEVYGAPREILELLGRIPGASVETLVNLSEGWALNGQGYWARDVEAGYRPYGLWVNDLHVRQVPYEQLALDGDRAFAQVGDRLFFKGEDLTYAYVESAYNVYVLRSLQEATSEIDRKTGTSFSRARIMRELHRGTYRKKQLAIRRSPITVDDYFRVDCYSPSRTLVRRYQEQSTFSPGSNDYSTNRLLVDGETGVIHITESFWDWSDWGSEIVGVSGLRGLNFFTPGEASLEVTYTGGPMKPPVDIAEACANLAAIRQGIFWQQALSQGMQGLSIGCLNLNFGQMMQQWFPGWQQGADTIIGGYQNIEIEAF